MTLPFDVRLWPAEARHELLERSGSILADLGVSSFTIAQVKAADLKAEALVRAWWAARG